MPVTPDSKRFLHPDAIRRIARMELRARYIVEGFLSGMHRSPYFGQSVEFLQHREYSVGDDLRHVDWKVWARHDRLTVKQYEEDTNLRCTLLVDVSGSMRYGNGPLNKFDYASTVAASLAYLVLKQQDAVGLVAFDEQIRATLAARSKRNHLFPLIESLSKLEPRDKSDIQQLFGTVAETYAQRGMMVVISDLLVPAGDAIRGLQQLRQRGHDVLVFHILDDDELDFSFRGPTRFEGLELPQHLNCNPRALRDGYLAALQRYLDQIRHGCARAMIDYALIRTSQPLDAALAAYLSNRLGMHHKN